MSCRSSSLVFFLLLSGPSSTLALSQGGVMSGLDGHARTEGRVQLGPKDKGGDRRSIPGLGDTHTSKAEVAIEDEEVELWRELGTTTNFRSTFSVSEEGLWEPRSLSRCVPIPSGMDLCKNIGYHTMRMPNLLGHESPAEAVQQSASWLPLLARECHPDARIFLCSLFAPICLDR